MQERKISAKKAKPLFAALIISAQQSTHEFNHPSRFPRLRQMCATAFTPDLFELKNIPVPSIKSNQLLIDQPYMREGFVVEEAAFVQPELTFAPAATQAADRAHTLVPKTEIKEENARCLREMLTTGDDALRLEYRNRLLANNQRLISMVAKKYAYEGVDFRALVSEGQLGLFEAIRDCTLEKIPHFTTFAVFCIRRAVLDYLYRSGSQILPPHAVKRVWRIRKAVDSIAMEKNLHAIEGACASEQISDDELAARTNIRKGTIRTLRPHIAQNIALDCPVDGESGSSFSEIIAEPKASPAEHLEDRDERDGAIADLELAIKSLKPEHAEIIRAHFGLGRSSPKSMSEIARERGVSQQRIQVVVSDAIVSLKENLQLRGSVRRLQLIGLKAPTTKA